MSEWEYAVRKAYRLAAGRPDQRFRVAGHRDYWGEWRYEVRCAGPAKR